MKRKLALLALAVSVGLFAQPALFRQNSCTAASASGTAYTCSISPAPAAGAYETGKMYWLQADVANTGSATVNFNSFGAKTITKPYGGVTTALVANDIRANQWVMLMYDGTEMQMLSQTGNAIPATVTHVITAVIDGGGVPIVTGALKDFPTADFSCTINTAMVAADTSGSITVDVWKANAAIPSSANKISASAPVTLSSAQLNQSSALTGWTTSVSTNDVFGFNVASASTVTHVVIQLWCQ